MLFIKPSTLITKSLEWDNCHCIVTTAIKISNPYNNFFYDFVYNDSHPYRNSFFTNFLSLKLFLTMTTTTTNNKLSVNGRLLSYMWRLSTWPPDRKQVINDSGSYRWTRPSHPGANTTAPAARGPPDNQTHGGCRLPHPSSSWLTNTIKKSSRTRPGQYSNFLNPFRTVLHVCTRPWRLFGRLGGGRRATRRWHRVKQTEKRQIYGIAIESKDKHIKYINSKQLATYKTTQHSFFKNYVDPHYYNRTGT